MTIVLRRYLCAALTALFLTFSQHTLAAELITNGSFETGNFTGWTAVNGTNPWYAWQVVSSGFSNGFMAPASPPHGSFVAYEGVAADAGGTFTLMQQITVPPASTASLTWRHRFQLDNNTYCNGATCGTATYAVEILNTSNVLLETLYLLVTGPDVTRDTGWQAVSRSLSAYAGQTIRIRFRTTVSTSYAGPGQLEIDQVSAQSPSILVPTAAAASVSGRVLNSFGVGLGNTTLALAGQDGTSRIARTNPLGYFRFDGVETGRTYYLTASAKGKAFEPVVITVADELTGIEIVAIDASRSLWGEAAGEKP